LRKNMVFLLAPAVMALAITGSEASAGKVRHHSKPAAKPVPAASAVPASPAVSGRNPDGTLHSPNITDAPADDFLRVAWCHGVLSGDMELAEIISSVYPEDHDLRLIGDSYLRAYEAALTLSGKGKSQDQYQAADDARQFGYNQWKAAREDTNLKEAAYAYASWQLPGECEHAAVAISGHPNLFAEMATDQEMQAVTAALTSGGPHDYDELPKPVLTASAAPADPDAAVSTNRLAAQGKKDAALPQITTPVPDSSSTTASSGAGEDAAGGVGPDHRKWSDGLAYRLGWTNAKKSH